VGSKGQVITVRCQIAEYVSTAALSWGISGRNQTEPVLGSPLRGGRGIEG